MESNVDDHELIVVMKRYFRAKAELAELKGQLEAARQATGADIGAFYDPRSNIEHASEILRSHSLKHEMVTLMDRAEAWGRAEITADRENRSEEASTEEDPSD